MRLSRSFRFADDELNDKLIRLVKKSRIEHVIDEDSVLHYSAADIDAIENDLICSVRDEVFSTWQVVTCPPEWTTLYRDYIVEHDIPFHEELNGDELWFLIPRKYRPHLWKLANEKPRKKELALPGTR